MTVQAPAKVNLTLRLLGRRPDGFHDIETLMVPISLSDEITIEVSPGSGITLTCSDPWVPADDTNLAWRAAAAFAARTGRKFHAAISLKKNIPSGAGLGGGSSDAAAVLLALNKLLGTDLSVETLGDIAAALGSDIAFFIRSRAAICRGRGEIIGGTETVPALEILLVKPPFPVPTAWAYQAAAPHHPPPVSQRVADRELVNDLEPPVFGKYLLLPALKTWLLKQPEVDAAMMSGSGSTIFAILNRVEIPLEARIRERFGPHMWMRFCRIKN